MATLEVTESLELVEENLQILRWVLLFATLLILIPTIIAGTLLSRLILRPIHSLIQTMEANRRQGTFQRLQWNQPAKDELGQMVSTYNKMMDWMEDSFHKQEQFVSDASHELKTPLTVIESYASLLKRWGRGEAGGPGGGVGCDSRRSQADEIPDASDAGFGPG